MSAARLARARVVVPRGVADTLTHLYQLSCRAAPKITPFIATDPPRDSRAAHPRQQRRPSTRGARAGMVPTVRRTIYNVMEGRPSSRIRQKDPPRIYIHREAITKSPMMRVNNNTQCTSLLTYVALLAAVLLTIPACLLVWCWFRFPRSPNCA